MLKRNEFEVLRYLEKNRNAKHSIKEIADQLFLSISFVKEVIELLVKKNMIDANLCISEEGLNELEKYRVKRAIILAAGFGSRMMPATSDKPKPMVMVNGVRIVETLLEALTEAGVEEITIVGGYCFDKLALLKEKYSNVRLIENKEYNKTNNISSVILSLDFLKDGTYLCEADLYISNPAIIEKYHYSSNILGSYSLQTDDWSYRMQDGFVTEYQKGNTFCYNYYGISYWTKEDCEKLRRDFKEVYFKENGKDYFWEFIPFVLKKENYHVEIKPCNKEDIMEIDNYYELRELDPSYPEA